MEYQIIEPKIPPTKDFYRKITSLVTPRLNFLTDEELIKHSWFFFFGPGEVDGIIIQNGKMKGIKKIK